MLSESRRHPRAPSKLSHQKQMLKMKGVKKLKSLDLSEILVINKDKKVPGGIEKRQYGLTMGRSELLG